MSMWFLLPLVSGLFIVQSAGFSLRQAEIDMCICAALHRRQDLTWVQKEVLQGWKWAGVID